MNINIGDWVRAIIAKLSRGANSAKPAKEKTLPEAKSEWDHLSLAGRLWGYSDFAHEFNQTEPRVNPAALFVAIDDFANRYKKFPQANSVIEKAKAFVGEDLNSEKRLENLTKKFGDKAGLKALLDGMGKFVAAQYVKDQVPEGDRSAAVMVLSRAIVYGELLEKDLVNGTTVIIPLDKAKPGFEWLLGIARKALTPEEMAKMLPAPATATTVVSPAKAKATPAAPKAAQPAPAAGGNGKPASSLPPLANDARAK